MSRGALALRFDLPPVLDTQAELSGTAAVHSLYSEKSETAAGGDTLDLAAALSCGSEVQRVRVLSDALMAENEHLRGNAAPVALTLLRFNREMLNELARIETVARMKDALLRLDNGAGAPEPPTLRLVMRTVGGGGGGQPARTEPKPGYRPLYGRRRHP
ncbi:hypothetical protein [Methylobacterium haplocladii]|uniref:Uncharacterized protein n=1 Tax=Methylobacterium haplocladii TaxID=1176176 RepID=A0A512ISA3_9HYPH|nr:hypothetical protein [Methylobacterium haplocladii]GEP00563.1 hypothetical protein MHA02_29500 [Methylobacterium haplocladii]GJD85478.1 hypothetical protein HPGCJGGD_3367 [Methylobacterium haplocladii]GLS57711.1 hypothetical protein GCM10007887_03670 [Methylobacterium haplocladii]